MRMVGGKGSLHFLSLREKEKKYYITSQNLREFLRHPAKSSDHQSKNGTTLKNIRLYTLERGLGAPGQCKGLSICILVSAQVIHDLRALRSSPVSGSVLSEESA